MATDLNDIYDPKGLENPPQEGPGKGLSSDAYMKMRTQLPDAMPRAGAAFDFNAPKSDIQKWFGDTGVGDPAITGVDNLLEMGRRQSVGNKVMRRVGNLVPNILSGFIDMAGRTGALATEWGDDRDYENVLTQAAASIRDPFGGNYARTDQATLMSTIADPTWWIDNTSSLIEFAVPFAVGGAVAGTFMSKAAEVAASTLRTGATATRAIRAGSQALTAGWMGFTEVAMSGEQVFKETYDNQLKKGLAEGMSLEAAQDNAKHIAAQSAASTVQIGTALSTSLNLHALAPYFRKAEDVAANALRSHMIRLPGETGKDWAARVKGLTAEDVGLLGRGAFHHKIVEAGMEGAEEVVQNFAQATGIELGKDGKEQGFLEQFSQLENFFDRVANKDGVLSFALGALGGGLMEYVQTDLLPSRRIEAVSPDGKPIQNTDKDGNLVFDGNIPVYKKRLATPRTQDEWQIKRGFNTMRDALAQDVKRFTEMEATYLDAIKSKDEVKIDKARNDLFNINQIHAVKTGMVDQWIETYQQIADIDNEHSLAENMIPVMEQARQAVQQATTPEEKATAEAEYANLIEEFKAADTTEAIQRGYAKDRGDDEYKKKAQDAISLLKQYQREYDRLKTKYGTQYSANQGMQQYVDMLFARKVDLLSTDKTLKEHEARLTELEAEEADDIRVSNPGEFSDLIFRLQRTLTSTQEVQHRMQSDLNALKGAVEKNDLATIKRLIRKYRAVGVNDTDLNSAIKDLVGKINRHNDVLKANIQRDEDNILNSPHYSNWREQNPNGTFREFMIDIQQRYQKSAENALYRANIESAREEYDIANQNYNDISSEKNITRMARKTEKWFNDMALERQRIEEAETAEISRRAKDKAALVRLQKIRLNTMARRYKTIVDQNDILINSLLDRINAVEIEKEKTSIYNDPIRTTGLAKQLSSLKSKLSEAQKRASKYRTLYDQYTIDTSSSDIPITVEEITQENNDVEELPEQLDSELSVEVSMANEIERELPPEDVDVISDELKTVNEILESIQDDTIADNPEDILNDIFNSSPEAIEVENDRDSYFVTKEYARLLKRAPEKLKERLAEIEDNIVKGLTGFSYDLLKPEIASGLITQSEAVQLLQALKEYMDATEQTTINPQIADFYVNEDTTEALEEERPMDSSNIGLPDSPIVNNDDPIVLEMNSPTTDGEGNHSHAGAKILNVSSIANLTLDYQEIFNESKKAYQKIPLKDRLNPDLNPAILNGKELRAGHNIRLEVDADYDGYANINDRLVEDEYGERVLAKESAQDYLTNGKVKTSAEFIGNVPIKIVDTNTGSTIGYVRKLDWIQAKYPNTTDHRNVVDSLVTRDGEVIDLMRNHIKDIMTIRNAVVTQFNNGQKPVEANIINKGSGNLILNNEYNSSTGKSKIVPGFARAVNPENSLLPDESLTLAIVGAEGKALFSGYEFEFPGNLSAPPNGLINGGVVALLPSANGTFMYSSLMGQKLAEGTRRSAVITAARAIELYLLNDGTNPDVADEIAKLSQNTGHDISTTNGLKNFLNQYFTYTQSFQQIHTAADAPGTGERIERFLFNIWDAIGTQTKGNIKVGWSYSGRPIVEAALVGGRLNPAFVEALEEGFSTRSRAVNFTNTARNIRGINSSGSFKDAVYTSGGKWVHKEYPSYNEYVKSFSKTIIYGRNQLPSGTYTYVANPSIAYEIKSATKVSIKENGTVKKVDLPITEPNIKDSDSFDDLNSFSFGFYNRTIQTQEIGTGPENSINLSIEALTELYNFTPETQRNGKTVSEVYENLVRHGHTFLSDGYNPFSRCL